MASAPQTIYLKVSLSEDGEQVEILEEIAESSHSQAVTPWTEKRADRDKSFQAVSSCCQEMCFRKVPEEEQERLYTQFCGVSKAVQDVFLSGLMRCRGPKTCRVEPIRRRDKIWRYFVLIYGMEISVCQKFLREVYQVTEKRIRVIQKKTVNGEAFGERRGKHGNRPGSIGTAVWDLAREHLSLIPSTEGLDGRSDKRYFADSELNIKKLYNMFKEFYRDKTGKELEKLAYKTYHKFFQNEKKYGFLTQLMITVKSDYKVTETENPELQGPMFGATKLCVTDNLQLCNKEEIMIEEEDLD